MEQRVGVPLTSFSISYLQMAILMRILIPFVVWIFMQFPLLIITNRGTKMRAFILLLYLNPFVWCQPHDIDAGEHIQPDLNAQRRTTRQVKTFLSKEKKPLIHELSVKTTIISRYAFTAVTCSMHNIYSAAIEGVFQFQIPSSAFVSNFTMIMAGQVYPSQIKAKKKKVTQLKEDKNQTQKEEQDSEGEVETFRVKAKIPGKNRALFLFTYEDLLVRRQGWYKHMTSLRPMQLVGKLSVEVTIVDHSKITYLEVLPLRNGRPPVNSNTALALGKANPPVSTVIQQNKTFCKISFSPSISQQKEIAQDGILGDFTVQYDVERDLGIADVQVLNGHFVHYFAPKDLPVVPKSIVFVIDISASMMGTKIKQTKEALFTILRDLRPNDHFNFVSFSNRIKVWKPGELVPVTPNNVRDAKKFIFSLSPTGGTDINRAIETGSELLSNYLSNKGVQRNGVSLLVFLTDGKPTVGEIRPPTILKNARSAVHGQFCIFTIGLGHDVDHQLLERLALDNCGTMRRISEKADASAKLKGFYDEIGTPLLSDVRVAYSQDAVEYVTQHLFTNYFNGSEIIIAGKLSNRSTESLHVQVTASGSNASVVLETDVALREREQKMKQRLEEAGLDPQAKGYPERVWGLLTIKDSLKTRALSQTSQERDEATQQATNLSLAYNFLTPVTSIVVETPNAEMPGPVLDRTAEPSAEMAEGTTQRVPGELEESGKPVKKPISEKEPIRISKTSVDGDPHFMVEFPMSKLTMCFNINGEPGQVLRLLSDHSHSGVTVNGKLIGAPAPLGGHKKQRTYFSTIAVVVSRPTPAYVQITPHKVILDGRKRLVLPTHTKAALEMDELAVGIEARSNVTVTIRGTISFVIQIHQYENPASFQRDHLGFYISNSKGLSENSHGLLGQFLHKEVSLTQLSGNATLPINMSQYKLQTNTSSAEIPKKVTKSAVTRILKPNIPTTVQSVVSYNTMQPMVPRNNTLTTVPTNQTQPDSHVTNKSNIHVKTKRSTDLTKATEPKKRTINTNLTAVLQLKVQTNQNELLKNTSQPQQPQNAKRSEPPVKTSQPQQPKTKLSKPPVKTSQPQQPKTKRSIPRTNITQSQQPQNAKLSKPPAKTSQSQLPPKTKPSEPPANKTVQLEVQTKTPHKEEPSKAMFSFHPTITTPSVVFVKTKRLDVDVIQPVDSTQTKQSNHSGFVMQPSLRTDTTQKVEHHVNTTQPELTRYTAQDGVSTEITQPEVTTATPPFSKFAHRCFKNTTEQKVQQITVPAEIVRHTNMTQNITQKIVMVHAEQKSVVYNTTQHKNDSIQISTQHKLLTTTAQGNGTKNTQHKVMTNTTQMYLNDSTTTTPLKVLSRTIQQEGSTGVTQHRGLTNTTQHKDSTTRYKSGSVKTTHYTDQMNTTQVTHKDCTNTAQHSNVANPTQHKGFINATQQMGPQTTVHGSGSEDTTHNVLRAKVFTNSTNDIEKIGTQHETLRNTEQQNGTGATTQDSGGRSATQSRDHENTIRHEVQEKTATTSITTKGVPSGAVARATSAAKRVSSSSKGAVTGLRIKGLTLAVTKKTRMVYSGSGARTVDCWFVKNSLVKLIDGQYENYVMSHLYDISDGPHELNGH